MLSHRSAAWLWGLVKQPADLVHVTSPAMRAPIPGVVAHRSGTLMPKDLRIHRALPVTSPARALLDSAPLLSARELELAFDRGLVERLVRTSQIQELLERAGNHPGRARLADLASRERGTALTRSEREERALELIRAAGLPEPQVNVAWHGFELDFYWPDRGVVLEVDGWQFHSTRARFARDHRKDAALREHRIEVVRVTGDEVQDEPLVVVARAAGALAGRDR